jgi:hypothetical protein
MFPSELLEYCSPVVTTIAWLIINNNNVIWLIVDLYSSKVKSKATLIAGHGGLQGCEMLRIPHCLDSRLTDCSKVVSRTHRPRSTPHKLYLSASGTYFCSVVP